LEGKKREENWPPPPPPPQDVPEWFFPSGIYNSLGFLNFSPFT
jgi:hypothetical protein